MRGRCRRRRRTSWRGSLCRSRVRIGAGEGLSRPRCTACGTRNNRGPSSSPQPFREALESREIREESRRKEVCDKSQSLEDRERERERVALGHNDNKQTN
ncbi:hypothetical protein F2Q70_00007373 [Brassica cretica]|uniref:Uncharacterized protein n=1 Tax=Brassica cretica TaxID=69181 RepID=A0A8S9JBU0_BRACR|nr:hypothetical protein F2Q68_00000442 [Brassica cretica]KAF2610081.1 hypothetical protein F2Q70_00007373 [Brassica cretica]